MRRLQFVSAFLLVLISSVAYASAIEFHNGNFNSAKNRANLEGKMLLVDFYASWCVPCKWMDETTFSDPSVIKKINQDYVSVKVNIDDFDGYALKEHYGVKVLPTVLIFNNEGKIIERIEETLPPSKMNMVLDKNKMNHSQIVHKPNISPEKLSYVAPRTSNVGAKKERAARYKLQLGVFSNYESTLKYYRNIKKSVDQPIIILHDYKGDNTIYRVLTGNFKNTIEAEIYKTDLKRNFNIDSNLYY